jgi:glutathione peroxidase
MKKLLATLVLVLLATPIAIAEENVSVHSFTVKTIDGDAKSLADYKGKALLVVNTASKCGFTSQYKGLEKLYQSYKNRGFEILAFPSNDFMGQEPGSDQDIKEFCSLKFKTTFPLFSKIKVKGEGQDPLYAHLTSAPGAEGPIQWNFNKFLVDPDGKVVARYPSTVDPESPKLVEKLESVLPAR